jgi:hypothetical protein
LYHDTKILIKVDGSCHTFNTPCGKFSFEICSFGVLHRKFLHCECTIFQNAIESDTSEIFKLACDVLQGKDASNMALPSTANNKEIPLGFLGNYFQSPPIFSVNTLYYAKKLFPNRSDD